MPLLPFGGDASLGNLFFAICFENTAVAAMLRCCDAAMLRCRKLSLDPDDLFATPGCQDLVKFVCRRLHARDFLPTQASCFA